MNSVRDRPTPHCCREHGRGEHDCGAHDELDTLLSRLRREPDHADLARVYDLTCHQTYAWALALTADAEAAAAAVVETYLNAWTRCSAYPEHLPCPWSWLRLSLPMRAAPKS